jgi:ribonuclease J
MAKSKNDELVFLPLGGSNEIGMNFNLYGYGPPDDRKWIVVDLGVTFGDQTTPGVEVILPDPEFMEQNADRLLGIVLTHAHEDHIGAVAHLWPRSPLSSCGRSFARPICWTRPRSQWCRWAGPLSWARSS